MKRLLAALLLVPALAAAAPASPATAVAASGGWVQAMPPGSDVSGAYLVLTNPGARPVKLLGATTDVAVRVRPMKTTREAPSAHGADHTGGGHDLNLPMLGMKAVASLTIPAKGKLVLSPDGDHLMLEGLRRVPRTGETVRLALRLSPGGELVVRLPVRRAP